MEDSKESTQVVAVMISGRVAGLAHLHPDDVGKQFRVNGRYGSSGQTILIASDVLADAYVNARTAKYSRAKKHIEEAYESRRRWVRCVTDDGRGAAYVEVEREDGYPS